LAVTGEPTQEFSQHSYIRRHGRLTRAQARALDHHTIEYAISSDQLQTYAQECALGIEIGFGMGHALFDWACSAPDWRLVGIELYQPGVGALTDKLHSGQVDNVRILQQPAQEAFSTIADGTVAEIRIFFPDPWPKKRHHKRRLIQPEFVAELARVLVGGGKLRLATDWTAYAQWMRECFAGQSDLVPVSDNVRLGEDVSRQGETRQTTKFERRGELLGHDIHDLVYLKKTWSI
jgi:tRNA (guanine-N7-)-methyltransferase